MGTALKKWLVKSGLTQAELARKTGIAESLMSKYIRGKLRPSLITASKIETATGGAVSVDSWLSDS